MLKEFSLITLVILLMGLSGCWDAQDVEELAFPIAAAYDLYQHKEESSKTSSDMRERFLVDVTTLAPNLAPKAKSPVTIETLSASTISYVREKRAFHEAESYNPGLVRILILGEDLARKGIGIYIDSLFRVPVISNSISFTVADGRGEDILKTPSRDYDNMGTHLKILLKEAQLKSFIPATTLHQIIVSQAPGKNPVLPLVKKVHQEHVIISGSAVFKKDRLIKKLDIVDTRTLVLLRGLKSKGYLPFFIEKDGEIMDKGTVLVNNSRKVEISREGDDFTFLIKIRLDGTLREHTGNRIEKGSQFTDIEKQIAADITRDCRIFVSKMQKDWQVDCIDISKYALAKWRKELTPVIDKDFIEDANIQVKVEVQLSNMGETNR